MLINKRYWYNGTPSKQDYRALAGVVRPLWVGPCIYTVLFVVGLAMCICANVLNPNAQPWHWYLLIMVWASVLPIIIGGSALLGMGCGAVVVEGYLKKRRKKARERLDSRRSQILWSGQAADLCNVTLRISDRQPYETALAALARQPGFNLDLCDRYQSDVTSFINDPDVRWWIDLMGRDPGPDPDQRARLESCLRQRARITVDKMVGLDEPQREAERKEREAIEAEAAEARQLAAAAAEHARKALADEIDAATSGG